MPNNHQHEQFGGLIFDCDGTLADTMPLHFLAWSETMQRHGIEFDHDCFLANAGRPTVAIIGSLLEEQSLNGNAVEIAAEKEQAFLRHLPEVKPIEAVAQIARQHHGQMPMGVGSGSNRAVVHQILDLIGMADLFGAVVGAEDTERHKPEPDVFLEVARQIGVEPERCQVFEDADLGLEAARRAGMDAFDIRLLVGN